MTNVKSLVLIRAHTQRETNKTVVIFGVIPAGNLEENKLPLGRIRGHKKWGSKTGLKHKLLQQCGAVINNETADPVYTSNLFTLVFVIRLLQLWSTKRAST